MQIEQELRRFRRATGRGEAGSSAGRCSSPACRSQPGRPSRKHDAGSELPVRAAAPIRRTSIRRRRSRTTCATFAGTAGRQPYFRPPVTVGARTISVETFVNEFWTSRQRAAHSLHEVSYRACFKPQLPRFFIERLTRAGDAVYDPFMGRGTTLLEAALLGRVPIGCDINPLSRILVEPRLRPPDLDAVRQRLSTIDWDADAETPEDLLTFYHPDTLREICALKGYLLEQRQHGSFDAVDGWIRMVALNRLTGHSAGFFSVYTLPPEPGGVAHGSAQDQRRPKPDSRRVAACPRLILAKSRSLLVGP